MADDSFPHLLFGVICFRDKYFLLAQDKYFLLDQDTLTFPSLSDPSSTPVISLLRISVYEVIGSQG